MKIGTRPSASVVSGTPVEPGEEVAHKSQSILILLLWILFRATLDKNVWPPSSQSACFQVSAVPFTLWQRSLCSDMHVSRLQPYRVSKTLARWFPGLPALLRQPCSTSLAPPALSERKECVKETWVARLKVQISKAYRKSGAAQTAPTACFRRLWGSHLCLLSMYSEVPCNTKEAYPW